jgi:hypothetical protein
MDHRLADYRLPPPPPWSGILILLASAMLTKIHHAYVGLNVYMMHATRPIVLIIYACNFAVAFFRYPGC